MAVIKLRLGDEELADIDRVRGPVPREPWLRGLAADAVVAHDALGGAGLSPTAPAVVALASNDPEDGPIGPHPTDAQVVAATGHDKGQPCRCPKCTPIRRRLRGWA